VRPEDQDAVVTGASQGAARDCAEARTHTGTKAVVADHSAEARFMTGDVVPTGGGQTAQ
jgi:NAD(P)-dependent dehydrogenase (short-subunit alcohol dehydrogenase family)